MSQRAFELIFRSTSKCLGMDAEAATFNEDFKWKVREAEAQGDVVTASHGGPSLASFPLQP